MQNLTTMFKQFIRDEEGVTAIEYGLIAALIAVVIIAAVKLVGSELDKTFDKIGSELQTANG
ncbi:MULTISPECIES: Flp family type IVb pilin [unclassified Cupriavidus]|uniref:Flp family type IVb pilin n=1 Tax=unclassified Cupriavidus TaxID=2640874 RepID=UPI00040D1D9A|nr:MULTISPECIES: Flp family type IVb pilin [unclassified Cupriavidus]MBP0634429.1 Flp family type IVb pilin [Cupriavidus sp. AcVe19-6a]